MGRAVRFMVPLLIALAALSWAAATVVGKISRQWFERDLALRAQLAIKGVRSGMAKSWSSPDVVRATLEEVTNEERVTAGAACSLEWRTIASTRSYPSDLSCREIGRRVTGTSPWHAALDLRGGRSFISAVPIAADDGTALGVIVLVQDLSYVDRREASAQAFYLSGFGVLALLAAIATVLVARTSWRGFRDDLRKLVRNGEAKKEFAPLMRDVRDLVARLSAESDGVDGTHAWTPARLKQTLSRSLQGERVIIVANREPYIHEEVDGEVVVRHPASGLVTALEPVMRACSGVWVAHGGGSADRRTCDAQSCLLVPPDTKTYTLRRVWLTAQEEDGYYYGFANEGLWPLCHVAHSRPIFRGDDYAHYEYVNRKFADAVKEVVDREDPIVLVQDYHFALVPRALRTDLPRATILSFWHIPWPNAELLCICPQHVDLVAGLLGSDIVGFHTQQHVNNFIDAVDRYLEARIDREQNAVLYRGRWTLIRAYPISIEWPSRWLAEMPSIAECRRGVIKQYDLPDDALIGVGVDRLDYIKGIAERFLAIERFFEKHPDLVGRFTFIQLAAPSRTKIERYRELGASIDVHVARIRERFGEKSVILARAHHEPPEVFRHYRAADVCYVSSLHDGMNLVAKEFVAARDDADGVLVLSRFTGAAKELTEALIVNPYDIDEASAAIAAALSMPRSEREERMRALRAFVAEWNVYRWAGKMLVDASRLRSSDSLRESFVPSSRPFELPTRLPWKGHEA